MVAKGTPVITQLEGVIRQECALYEEYLSLLAAEEEVVVNVSPDKILSIAHRREALHDKLQDAQAKRKNLLKSFPEGDTIKLSEIIARHCHPDDAKRIIPLVRKLKAAIAAVQQKGREANQVVDFSLRMVGGCLSLLHSGTQNVTRVYGRKGAIKESYNPGKAGSTLKQA